MDIIISGKNFKLTPSLKVYVQEKFGKLARYWGRIVRTRVELDVEHNQATGEVYRVEAKVEVPGPDITIGEKASDMHAAIDAVVEKLQRLISKAKGKGERELHRIRHRQGS